METEILLIENNPYDAEFIQQALMQAMSGIHIVHVTRTTSALDYLFGTGNFKEQKVSRHPGCILLGIPLPDSQGLDFLKTLKAYVSTYMIPVIVLAPDCSDIFVENACRLGANECIGKSTNPHLFSQRLEHLKLYCPQTNAYTSKP